MERIVAIKKLGKMLGKGFGYRVDPKAPTADEREEAKRQLPTLTAARQEAEKAMNDRREAVLAGDQEYQQLLIAWREAKKIAAQTGSMTHHYRFTVGTSGMGGLFFSVKAQGDSWDDVIDQLKTKVVA